MRYPKIIDELYGGKITVVQLVLTIPNPIDFVKNYDRLKGKKNARQMNENLKKWKEAQKKSGIKR